MKNLTANEVVTLLRTLNACSEARKWAEGKDLRTVWMTCERGDWLLWLLRKMVGAKGWPELPQVISACCECADLARPYIKDDVVLATFDHCQKTTRKWTRGEATISEVRAAADAAADTYADAAAADTAVTDAAYAAAAADADAAAAAYAAYAAYVADAADAAYAAAYDAAYDDAALAAVRKKSLKKSADICREILTDAVFEIWNKNENS